MSSHRHCQLRCLKHLYWSAAAIVLTLYTSLMDAGCDMFKSLAPQVTCPRAEMPAPLFWALAAMFVYGLVAFAHRVYRDFYKGDLLWDFPGD